MLTENLPVVAGITVTTDECHRFNLNALHKASGEGDSKRPREWLRTKQAQALITELKANLLKNIQRENSPFAHELIKVKKGGTNPGTDVHEILAVEYAGWIRPDFRLMVNQTFIDYRSGHLLKVTEKKKDYLAEFRQSRALKMVISSVNELFEMMPKLSLASRQSVAAHLINPVAGFEAVPLPKLAEKLYSATEIGKFFSVSANKIGRIANDNDMKTEEYGEYYLDKSRYSDKQVPSFRYNQKARDKFRRILMAEQEVKQHVLV